MATRFMTDPHAMRAMAGRFETHAQTVEDEARRMWASSQNIAGAGWSGTAQATSYDTMGQMNQAFRNIVNMLHGVRDGCSATPTTTSSKSRPRSRSSAASAKTQGCVTFHKLGDITMTINYSSAMSTRTAP